MCAFTGIDTAQQFKDLLNLLTPLTSKMKYWTGDSRLNNRGKVANACKPGPPRKLSIQSEFVFTVNAASFRPSTYFFSQYVQCF